MNGKRWKDAAERREWYQAFEKTLKKNDEVMKRLSKL